MVIIITGATSGIGKETASLLKKEGHTIYCLARRVLQDENIHYLQCDLKNKEEIKQAITQIIFEQNRIDCIINNAGMGISGAFEHHQEDEMETILKVNLEGLLYFTKLCIPYLKKTQGRIINISSIAGAISIPFQTMYSLTKAAIISFSKGLRNELKPFKVKVCCILPGDIATEFSQNRVKSKQEKDYQMRIQNSIAKMEKDEKNGMSPSKVAKKIQKIIHKKNPPILCSVGFQYQMILFLSKVLPARIISTIIYQMYAK